jgi:DNA (cytosine-5)-methyltransferase 3A
MKEIVTIELFGGMGTGIQALKNLGYYGTHFYSDIKKAAIKVTLDNHPNTIMLGDVRSISYKNGVLKSEFGEWKVPNVHLISSGSPCKDLSIAGKRKGLEGSNSSLFYEFLRILNEVRAENPNVFFLQENVGSAPKSEVLKISQALGVLPVRINSKLVVAQLRDRYYWSNIKTKSDWTGDVFTDIPQPKDRKILLKDIIESGFTNKEKANCLLESESRITTNQNSLEKRSKKEFCTGIYEQKEVYAAAQSGRKNEDGKIVQKIELNKTGKSNCLTTVSKDSLIYEIDERKLKETQESNATIQVNKAKEFSDNPRNQNRVYAEQGKFSCLVVKNNGKVIPSIINFKIRVLSKIELQRLQGFPDDYCKVLSRNETASVCGDGWTLPIIEHIYSFLKI